MKQTHTVWVGLTGGIGSGKSQVAAELAKLGVPIINADEVNKEFIDQANSPSLQEIAAVFGQDILDNEGKLNRSQMRDLIFSNPTAKKQLESILHPKIIASIKSLQTYYNTAYGVVELPTLIEHPHFQCLVQHILCVCANEAIRIERVKQRSGLNEESIRAVMATQASDEQRLALADSIIENNADLNQLNKNVYQWHHEFMSHLSYQP